MSRTGLQYPRTMQVPLNRCAPVRMSHCDADRMEVTRHQWARAQVICCFQCKCASVARGQRMRWFAVRCRSRCRRSVGRPVAFASASRIIWATASAETTSPRLLPARSKYADWGRLVPDVQRAPSIHCCARSRCAISLPPLSNRIALTADAVFSGRKRFDRTDTRS